MSDTAISPEVKAALPSMREAIYGNGTPAVQPVSPQQPIPQPAAQPAAPAPPASDAGGEPATPAAPDYNTYLKEKFGFDNEEVALGSINKWRQLETNPPPPKPIEYKNETSKRIHEYLNQEKYDEVHSYLDGQRKLAGLDTMNEEQRIKLYIKLNNPMYDQELIDYEYNQNYTFNEAKFKDEEGNITDPLALRHAKTQAAQKLQTDAAKANEFFTAYKEKINLPEIKAEQAPDAGYQEFQTLVQQQQEGQRLLEEATGKLTAQEATFAAKFNDEANKFSFDSSYVPDEQALAAGKAAMINVLEFMDKNYRNADGSPQPGKLLSHMTILSNLDKFVSVIQTQAVNAERKRALTQAKQGGFIPRNYNIDATGEGQMDKNRSTIYGKTGS